MARDRDRCFRVSGIPGDYTESEIKGLLSRELSLANDDVEIFSLARNPLRRGEQIATLSLSQIPATLAERGEQYVNIPSDSSGNKGNRGPRRQIVLDSHFEGFTPLHAANDDECYMDIVALSGLNGHAFGSFKEKGGSHMWLRDALPYDLYNARILTYGYNTSPERVSFQNIWDLESTFRQRLRMVRDRSNSTRRPLIIIAHSLGGIIAKAAVVKMADDAINGDHAAYESLRGILLFGVPSQGMDIKSLIPMVPASEMRALLCSLDKNNSPTLRELGQSFPKMINKLHNFQAFNFYETRESPTATRDDDGRWEMKGPPTVLVTPYSATQGKLTDEPGHRVIALNRTHSEMTKFRGTNDDDYETTLDCLKKIEEHIIPENSVWPTHTLSIKEQGCLKTLSFPELQSREYDPNINAVEGTCTWVSKNENHSSWSIRNSGLLWIMGPPGAGKSTLMKFMVNAEREKQRDRDIVAAFFIHGQGNDMQRSHLGLYQSLLHQMLPHCPGPLSSLAKIYETRTNTRGNFEHQKWKWEEEELREFLVSTVLSESHRRNITVFIDALDEMGEEPAVKLISNLKQLHSNDLPQSSRIKLCLSCRYYPNLVEEGSLAIAVESANSRDINFLIETHSALSKLRLSDREAITKIIIQRANGIFQWVSLVLDEVKRLRRQGQPAAAVISRIKEVPGTLKGIYDALLVFENEHDREQTTKLFQWILFSFEPLRLEDLRQALAIDANMTHKTLEEITKSRYYYELEDMPTVVQSLSRGLARVTGNSAEGKYLDCVETIHQSVNDYLLRSGLEDLAESLTGNPEGLAHFQISRCCIKLLHVLLQNAPLLESSDEYKRFVEKRPRNHSDLLFYWNLNVPLALYAQNQWLNHVIRAERYGIDQRDLLEHLPWRKSRDTLPIIFTKRWNLELFLQSKRNEVTPVAEMLARILWNEDVYHWDPVHLLALAGIHSALDKMERAEPEIYNRMDPSGHTTLLFALAGCNEKIVASAMNILAHHHVSNERFIVSPLFLAVNHGREDWVQAIINEGADLDQMNRTNHSWADEQCSALYSAWLRKDDKIIRRLLSAGADPSIICSETHFDKTVIHEALKETDRWSKDILLLLVESAINLYPTKRLPNLTDDDGDTSTLSYAIDQENIPLVQLLLDSGARQDCPDRVHVRDGAAFNTAAAKGLQKIVKVLLNNRVNPSSSFFGMSLLHEAAANGHSSVVRLLLDAGARPTGLSPDNEHEYSCLVALKHSNCKYTLESFVSSGRNSRDPVEMAMNNGHAAVVQTFLEAANSQGVASKARIEEIRSLPWTWYMNLAVKGNLPAIVLVLLEGGIDPNRFGFLEKPLLNIAVEKGWVEVARILLQYGADPTLTDISLNTALQRAIGGNHLEILNMLLDWRDTHGRTLIMLEIFVSEEFEWLPLAARRDGLPRAIQEVLDTEYIFNVQDNKGLTVFSYAVIENRLMIVDNLLDHGRSDPNKQSLQGETPLMRAASAGFEDILRRLLACPLTDIEIEDEDGLTAMDHARRAGNSTIVALLRKKQDELLAQRGRGRSFPLRAIVSTGMMGTLRRHQY